MFDDFINNKVIIEGAYRKFKSYYYYNKNFLVIREKIAEFESDYDRMGKTIEYLAICLNKIDDEQTQRYFEELYSKIDIFVVPKKFVSVDNTKTVMPISNTTAKNKKLNTVNYFIDLPIELHILDVIWTLFVGKIAYDNNIISRDVYGNTISDKLYNNSHNKESIAFSCNRMFNIYFYKYCTWRNKAFESLENNYNKKKDSVLLSLDLQSYFYSVRFDFDNLKNILGEHHLLASIAPLTKIIQRVYCVYKKILEKYKRNVKKHKENEFPLPIGLFSSMLLGNLYLSDFDKTIRQQEDVLYYGRYVDDLLIVFDKKIEDNSDNEKIIKQLLIDKGLFKSVHDDYVLINHQELNVQKEKVKIICIDHKESKAILDIYNNNVKVVPSGIDVLPNYKEEINGFDENAYSIEHFNKENKLRDIGAFAIDSFKISKFFSALIMRYSQIDVCDKKRLDKELKILEQNILQIEKFFTGSQCVEYYAHWMNYMYFLVITQRYRALKSFYKKTLVQIDSVGNDAIDEKTYIRIKQICKKVKEYLKRHLRICLHTVLCLDLEVVQKSFPKEEDRVRLFANSNMFNHSLIAFPLSNYLKYDKDLSYIKMGIEDMGTYLSIADNDKFKWSPRFIHYDELLLFLFYSRHKENQSGKLSERNINDVMDRFIKVNHLNYSQYKPFEILTTSKEYEFAEKAQYVVDTISIPSTSEHDLIKYFSILNDDISIAVANIKLNKENIMPIKNGVKRNRWKNISIEYKKKLFNVLEETYICNKDNNFKTKILVLPELCVPIYWLKDIIKFAKQTQTAIVAGLQYIIDKNNRAYNYVVNIIPFASENGNYKNAFVFIREKNDYSPIEKKSLAEKNYHVKDSIIARYQVFQWNGIDLATLVCYEMTDVIARAILKGKCDIIAAPVFNQDTTYFSNIIDTTTRDLHAFIVQSNTSIYGDSRVSGPYRRDYKDIFKIKGGENDNVLVGYIDFTQYMRFQKNYYSYLEEEIMKKRGVKNRKEIKPFSARFFNKRTNQQK